MTRHSCDAVTTKQRPLVRSFDELVHASGLAEAATPLDDLAVLAAVKQCYGLGGDLRRIATEKDDTFELRTDTAQRLLVKISGPAESPEVVNLQTEALLHVSGTAPSLPVPTLAAGSDGRYEYDIASMIGDHTSRILRIMAFLDGVPLASHDPTPGQLAVVGSAHAQLASALSSFTHAEQRRVLAWDLRYIPVLRELVCRVDEPGRRARAAVVIDAFEAAISKHGGALKHHVVHGDFSPHNVLVDPTRPGYLTGVIDFGDVNDTPEVFDVAIALSNQLDPYADDPWARALKMFTGYARTRPLDHDEILLLPTAVVARSLQRALIAHWRASHDPTRAEYVLSHARNDWGVIERLRPATWHTVVERVVAVNSSDEIGMS